MGKCVRCGFEVSPEDAVFLGYQSGKARVLCVGCERAFRQRYEELTQIFKLWVMLDSGCSEDEADEIYAIVSEV